MDAAAVEAYLTSLQDPVLRRPSRRSTAARRFASESWDRPEGGGGISRVLAEGDM